MLILWEMTPCKIGIIWISTHNIVNISVFFCLDFIIFSFTAPFFVIHLIKNIITNVTLQVNQENRNYMIQSVCNIGNSKNQVSNITWYLLHVILEIYIYCRYCMVPSPSNMEITFHKPYF